MSTHFHGDSGQADFARHAARRTRVMRRALGVGLGLMCVLGLLLLFSLIQATSNQAQYERHFIWLLGVNVLVAVLLLTVLLWGAVRLGLRLQRGRFGSRLLIKLAGIFALVGVLPGLLVYVVSYQFVARSIESWFDVRVEGALSAGVSLARVTLDTIAADFADQTRAASSQLAQVPDVAAGVVLERIREQLGAADMVLWSAQGQPLAIAGQLKQNLMPERPDAQQLRHVRQHRTTFQFEGLDEIADLQTILELGHRAQVRVLVVERGSASIASSLTEPRFVQATLVLSPTLVANALAVQQANREYQERALARGGLRRMYIATLTLTLFLTVFAAVLLAVLLGHQIVRPLLVLADGVREVAAGNLQPKAAWQSRDELGGLTRSFALMTEQLAEARSTAQHSMEALDHARAHLQTILDNLTAGVIVLDAQDAVRSSNPGASRILRTALADWLGHSLRQVPSLDEFAMQVQRQFEAFQSDGNQHGPHYWQQAFELHGAGSSTANAVAQQQGTSLVVRGANLPDGARLLVFDDITEIVSAQRAQAWGEVARRLAHEIKNPLTPIQLSAERLEHKLANKLPATDQAMLAKSVKTIVDQVDAMKHLVNEFRDYARLPSADMHLLSLNALIADVLQLYDADNATVPVQADLDPLCPPIVGDAQQLRQVIHNLLQNSQDATLQAVQQAPRTGRSISAVRIVTHWNSASRRVRLSVSDSGVGFSERILQRAFEPYVTTKTKGTGLGLAVVKKIADEHAARIDLRNRMEGGVVLGAQVSLSFVAGRKLV